MYEKESFHFLHLISFTYKITKVSSKRLKQRTRELASRYQFTERVRNHEIRQRTHIRDVLETALSLK